jgi:hypothetical protein
MEQVSPYLSEPKADFTPNYESVAVKPSLDSVAAKRSLDRSMETQKPTIYPTERKRSLINPVVDQ